MKSTVSRSFNHRFPALALFVLLALVACQNTNPSPAHNPQIQRPKTPDVASIALAAPQPEVMLQASPNTLENGNFETLSGNAPSVWQECGQVPSLQSSNLAASGSRAGLLSKAGSCLYQTVPTTPGTSLQASCQVRVQQGLGWSGMGFAFADANFQKLSDAPTRTVSGSSYTLYETQATAPANAAYITLWAYTDGQILVDDCGLKTIDTNQASNLLVNPGFESGLSNWQPCSSQSLLSTSTQSQAGALAAKLTSDGTAGACLYQDLQTKAGREYELICQTKVTGLRWTSIGLAYSDANWQSVAEKYQPVSTGGYQTTTIKLSHPVGAEHTSVVFYSESTEALFDACVLRETGVITVTGDGLSATYFDNIDFSGTSKTRKDTTVNFDWAAGSPDPSIGPDTWSARWTGQIEVPSSGTWTFYTNSDDGVRLDVNGIRVINNWTDHSQTEDSASISLSAGRYPIQLEFFENGGGATAQLSWSGPGVAKQIVPQSVLYSSNTSVGSAYTRGQWSAVQNWPLIAIHATLMPTGEVLAWDSIGDDVDSNSLPDHTAKPTRATLWNPNSNTFSSVDANTGKDLFCSGQGLLSDGRLLAAGGNQVPGNGTHNATSIFDASTRTWSRGPNMAQNRWYPSLTPLANGESLISGGGPNAPEVFNNNGSLRALTGLSISEYFPWLQTAPNGTVTYLGPGGGLGAINTGGTGSWQALATRDSNYRDYGGHAIFDTGKVLVAGGGASLSSSKLIDLNSGASSDAGSMNIGRRQHNLTLLADGSALATGGISNGAGLYDAAGTVLVAERYLPSTNRWDLMASASVARQYHSTALLLPDGRVLSAGGGFCGACPLSSYSNKNAEIYSPPYLFNPDGSAATRPSIGSAPNQVSYGASFTLQTSGDATRVALVRLGSVTHSVNFSQRYVKLNISRNGTSLSVTAPSNANIAPPGHYMLFVLSSRDVPSLAKIIKLQ